MGVAADWDWEGLGLFLVGGFVVVTWACTATISSVRTIQLLLPKIVHLYCASRMNGYF